MPASVRERDVESGGKHNVVLLLPCRRIGYVHIAKHILPTEPFVDLRHGAKVKRGTILAGIAEVREEVSLLRDDGRAVQLMHEFVANLCSGEVVDQVRQGRKLSVVFTRVSNAAQEIERGVGRLDRMKAETTAKHRAKFQILESIETEVSVHENKQPGLDVVIVASATFICIRGHTGGSRCQAVRRVH